MAVAAAAAMALLAGGSGAAAPQEPTPPPEPLPEVQDPLPQPVPDPEVQEPVPSPEVQTPPPVPPVVQEPQPAGGEPPVPAEKPVQEPPAEGDPKPTEGTPPEGAPEVPTPPEAGAAGAAGAEPGGVGAAAAVPEGAGAAAAEPAPGGVALSPVVLGPFAPSYRSLAGSSDLLQTLARAAPRLAGLFEVGRELDGRPVLGLQFGAPGPVPLERRPTIVLIGGLDGVSLSGCEAVLACAHHLLAAPERMPEGIAFVAIPWASPQGLERLIAGTSFDGRNLRPVDDDLDGRVDEDGPDDLDGNGQILSMLVPQPGGAWVRREDARFLTRARPGDQPAYALTLEGDDDDGDGLFNEDPAGGVVLDRNFPVNRTGSWRVHLAGQVPMSEPLVRAYADLVLGRRTVAVVLLQGNHGWLAAPGGLSPGHGIALPLESDLPVYRRLTELFARSTGRAQPEVVRLGAARGSETPGSALDWLYVVPGALAVELAVWGPRVELGRQVVARDARFGGEPDTNGRDGALPRLAVPLEARREWAPWVDNVLGGLGFMSWQPVQLSGGREGLVGGWEPQTVQNPPEATLGRALQGVPEFVAALAAALPRLELLELAHKSQGEVHRLSARVRNTGLLPSGLDRSLAEGDAGGVLVELSLPAGAMLIAGDARVVLPRLQSEEVSAEVVWLVLAAPGAQASVSVSSAWTLPRTTKVRL